MAKSQRELREQMLKNLREKQAKGDAPEAAPEPATATEKADSPESKAARMKKIKLGALCGSVAVLGLIWVAKAFEGESDNWGRIPVRGTVTVTPPIGTEPPRGTVTMIPTGPEGGPAAMIEFSRGSFAFNGVNGPVSGPHRAIVQVETGRDPKTGKIEFEEFFTTTTIPSTKPLEVNLQLSKPAPTAPTPTASTPAASQPQ